MAEENTNTDNTDAGEAEAFNTSLGETNKGSELFTGVESAEQLGQKYVDLHKENEEVKASRVVVPENLADYKFDPVEGVTVDEVGMGSFREASKGLGLSAEQFAGVVAFDLARNKAGQDSEKARALEATDALKASLGDKYDSSMVLADKVLRTFGSEALADDVDLGNNPDLFGFLLKVGAAVSEDSLTGSTSTGGDGGEKDIADILFENVVAPKK